MKKIFLAITAICALFATTSCSDMLNSEPDNQNFDPALDSKADSIFYSFGVMQAMQQLADINFFLGEVRGDLVDVTEFTDENLRQLADFSATTENKYDSAYVYYRVINNCNYFIAHRDTTLTIGGNSNVAKNEIAAMHGFRAWAYMQLARNYGKVPFFTEPLTSISQINDNNFPELDMEGILRALEPSLLANSNISVPDYGTLTIGTPNGESRASTVKSKNCFIPVDVVLGDMYLEVGEYENAAKAYFRYITLEDVPMSAYAAINPQERMIDLPSDFASTYLAATWRANDEVCSVIPMAVNRLRGTTSVMPAAFGYEFYSLSARERWNEQIQLVPSTYFTTFGDSADYFYYRSVPEDPIREKYVGSFNRGDQRVGASLNVDKLSTDDTQELKWVYKFNVLKAQHILYRPVTVYLHLAEAFNRMGYPDLAFGLLKEGLNDHLTDVKYTRYINHIDTLDVYDEAGIIIPDTATYDTTYTYRVRPEASAMLLEGGAYPFFAPEYNALFHDADGKPFTSPIHAHGAGVTSDGNYPGFFPLQSHTYPGRSPYQFHAVVGEKLKKLASNTAIYPGLASRIENGQTTMNDTIMAVEELLCEENALELGFEGNRWYDLMRIAKHKNSTEANSGSNWLADRLKFKNPTKDLKVVSNWYLPFKK